MDFNTKIEKIFELVNQKIKNNEIDDSLKIISGMLDIVEKKYSKEFKELLNKTGVSKDLELWTEFGLKFNKQIDSLEIDPWLNRVEITLGDEKLTSGIYNINEYVNCLNNISPAERLLISSFLSNSTNFKIIQLYHNFIK